MRTPSRNGAGADETGVDAATGTTRVRINPAFYRPAEVDKLLVAFTLMCVMQTVIFVATGRTVFPMIWGTPTQAMPPVKESMVAIIPKVGFVGVLSMLGTYTPEPVSQLLRAVAQSIGGI